MSESRNSFQVQPKYGGCICTLHLQSTGLRCIVCYKQRTHCVRILIAKPVGCYPPWQPCRFVWLVVLNVFKLFLFKTKPHDYNLQFLWCLLKPSIWFCIKKTDHEGVKPCQNQNQEVYCSTKTPSYVTQIYNSGSVYIGQANHEASWNMNSRISRNIYDNTTLSMDHVNAPCIIEHTFLYRSCS